MRCLLDIRVPLQGFGWDPTNPNYCTNGRFDPAKRTLGPSFIFQTLNQDVQPSGLLRNSSPFWVTDLVDLQRPTGRFTAISEYDTFLAPVEVPLGNNLTIVRALLFQKSGTVFKIGVWKHEIVVSPSGLSMPGSPTFNMIDIETRLPVPEP